MNRIKIKEIVKEGKKKQIIKMNRYIQLKVKH